MRKATKLGRSLLTLDRLYLRALRFGVVPALEHDVLLRSLPWETVVDIGANRGQFALLSRRRCPKANIISFEPLIKPVNTFKSIFRKDSGVTLHQTAIGPTRTSATMHVSRRDDSSSLLPIGQNQARHFPGTWESGFETVTIARLCDFVSPTDIRSPALLKIDVQGYELEALKGCESLLSTFTYVCVECSFVELYTGQALAPDVIDWLRDRGFRMQQVYSLSRGTDGYPIQADFLFGRT